MLPYHEDGRVVCVGAHEEALIWRAASGRFERVPVEGTWLGVIREIAEATVETKFVLEVGDLLVLYTDGAIEARDGAGEIFGLDRVAALVEAHAASCVADIRDRVLDAVLGDPRAARERGQIQHALLVRMALAWPIGHVDGPGVLTLEETPSSTDP